MTSKKEPKYPLGIQLELFQSSKRLNLSETYEAIPKDVSATDPAIVWINDYMAEPIEKTFSIGGQSFVSEIIPATIKDKKINSYKSVFPNVRESKIEYAIISLASKQIVDIGYDKKEKQIHLLKTTYYQIQKEIVDAINLREGKNLSPNECPYNTTSIKEALEVLRKTTITVKDEKGEKQYIFSRIKDMYMDSKYVAIELGTMATDYINSGDWKATDQSSILASKGKYELKLRVLLNLKFRYATQGAHYNPSLNFLINYLDFLQFKEKRTTLQRITKIIESMHEIEKVVVDKKYEGRKIIDAIFYIYPKQEFISMIIENNKAKKRTETAFLGENDSLIIEPMQSDFISSSDFQKEKREYDIKKGKYLFNKKKNLFN